MKKESVTSLEELGKNIRIYRKRLKMTQTDVAKLLGVSQATVSYWENGEKNMSLYELMEVTRILGTDILNKQDYFKCIK